MAKVEYKSNLRAMEELFEARVANAISRVQREYARDVSRKLDEPPKRTGRIYNIPGNRGQRHQASRGGEAPAPMSREYLHSIFSEVLRQKRPFYRGVVYTDQEQAATLELGLGEFQGEARPAWWETLIENRKKYTETIEYELKRGGL